MLLDVRTPGLASALAQIDKAYAELDAPEPNLKRVAARTSAADKGRLIVSAEIKARLSMPKIIEADARIIEAQRSVSQIAAPAKATAKRAA